MKKNFPVCGMIMLLGVTYYIIGGILISFLIFKCSFLFYMWKHFLKFAQKLCEDRLRSLENIKVNFMFHSLALSLHCEPCKNWLNKYEDYKSCIFNFTCGIDYGVVPCSWILQLRLSIYTFIKENEIFF